MDAHEELLLSEGVCNQLGVVNYHTDIRPGSSEVTSGPEQAAAATTGTEIQAQSPANVRLTTFPGTPALKEGSKAFHEELGLTVEDALVVPDTEGVA